MSRIISLSLLIFICQLTELSAQKYILSTNIGYQYQKGNKSNYSPHYYAGQNQETIHELTLNLRGGKAIGTHFIIGVGIGYNRLQQVVLNAPYVPNPASPSSGYTTRYSPFETEFIKKQISPTLFIEHFTNLSDKFMLSLGMLVQYSISYSRNSTSNNLYTGTVGPSTYGPLYFTSSNPQVFSNEDPNTQAIGLRFQPTLRYKLFENAGLELSLGGINFQHDVYNAQYPNKLFKEQSKQLAIEFAPKNWLLGFFMVF